jgi:uncharacterized Zn finger protein
MARYRYAERYSEWPEYVSVAQRRANAERELASLRKKGRQCHPVVIEGLKIARTFWGKAWCDNLETYSDYASRLPRGRSYVRNGSVVDLAIDTGEVTALVSGSEIYTVRITVKPQPKQAWKAIAAQCTGQIGSLVELLQGKLSATVMEVVTREKTGLFPAPREIAFRCSCPDGAWMCKHVAAALYGVGARLDDDPALLFRLRHVDPEDLVRHAGASAGGNGAAQPAPGTELAGVDLSALFGIDIEALADEAPKPRSRGRPREARRTTEKPPAAAALPAKSRKRKERSVELSDGSSSRGKRRRSE